MAMKKVFGIVLAKTNRLIIPQVCKNHHQTLSKSYCTSENYVKGDVGSLFLKPDVQDILKRITGFNLNKVFRAKQSEKFAEPDYELMTDEQLKQSIEEYETRAREHLQMVPVMKNWNSEENEILSEDAEIEGFADNSYVFIDISAGVKRRERTITIREPNGTLRTATPPEKRDCLNLMFPIDNRLYKTPEMFEESNLEIVLGEGRYEYILDRACIQFEPDDPHFNQVTQRTYEHLDNSGSYDILYSTRHFGPFVFHLCYRSSIDGLLIHLISTDRLTDAGDLVRLFYLVRYDKKVLEKLNPHQLINGYLSKNCHKSNLGRLELALQSYDSKHNMKDKQEVQQ